MAKTTKGFIGKEKRGNKVYLFARFDYTDANGVRRSIKRRVKTITDGKRALPEMIRDVQENGPTSLEADKLTVNAWLKIWLDMVKPTLAPRTFQDYTDTARRYIESSAVGRTRLSKLKPVQIQALYSAMQNRNLGARTVRYVHTVLLQSLKYAVKRQMLRINPATALDLPRHVRREMRSLSLDESKQFLEAAESDKHGLIFLVALHSGMRPEEYLGMQWKDIDLGENCVNVQRIVARNRRGGGYYFDTPKTPKSRRRIPLSVSVMTRLREHRREQLERILKAGTAYQNLDLVFATAHGRPLAISHLREYNFKPLLERAGLPSSIRLYDLRHSCATLLLLAGVNPKIVSERLGHASIVMTLDTYSHILPGMQQGATDSLERMLARA